MRAAVFLDRDGVLNEMILNPKTGEHESPHNPDDVVIFAGTYEALKELQENFYLFIVSNQPSFAKGKASMKDLENVDKKIQDLMTAHGIKIKKSYYCYHHPESVVPELRMTCPCRKPGNLFLRDAARDFDIDLKKSWMVGDRDIDVTCGETAGCKTILIDYEHSKDRRGRSKPTFHAKDIVSAAEKILNLREITND